MSTVAGILLFILLAPLLGGLLAGLGAVISAGLRKEEPPHMLMAFRELASIFSGPWKEARGRLLCTICWLISILAGGVLFFSGGNIALAFLLLILAEGIRIYKEYGLEGNPGTAEIERDIPSAGFEKDIAPAGLEQGIASAAAFAGQILVTAIGFYFVVGMYPGGEGFSFYVADTAPVRITPALYLPVMLLGFVWLLLRVSGAGFGSSLDSEEGENHGKEQALVIIGGWYRTVILYGVLFLFNYNGTAPSAVLSASICLLTALFGLLLRKPHSRPPGPTGVSAVSAVLLIASFINLFILLP